MFEFEENLATNAKIKVVGVGGGGGNAIRTMMKEHIAGVDFVAINTDVQSLKDNDAMVKIQIGSKLTRGLGAGANPQVGRDAALEDAALIGEAIAGSDMIFITAGLGGGTGTGAVPVIAKIARDLGILAVCIVTKPFSFEGRKRMRQAEAGIALLKESADTIICIPNDNMLSLAGKDTPIVDSFKMVDYVLLQAVRGISDLITTPGLINLDFADIRTIMKDAGLALMGTGIASGESRALEAAKLAVRSPLLEEVSVTGATGILLNIRGSSNMTLFEVNEASKLIQQECHEDANIIFGTVVDESMKDDLRITVIATGFGKEMAAIRSNAREHVAPPARANVAFRTAENRPQQRVEAPESVRSRPLQTPASRAEGTQRPATFAQAPARSTNNLREIFEELQRPAPEPLFEDVPRPSGHSVELDMTEGYEEPARVTGSVTAASLESRQAEEAAALFTKKPASSWGMPAVEPVAAKSEPASVPPRVSRRPVGNLEEKVEFKKIFNDLGIPEGEADEYDIPAFIRRRAD